MFTVWYKQELDRRGWMTGRQVEEHTGWRAGRYRVGDPGARRTQRLRTEGNMEHKMYLEMQKSLCRDWLSTTVVETTIWRRGGEEPGFK